MTYQEFCEAYKQAKRQRNYYTDEVSGRWFASGEKFCEKYGLDYEEALNSEREERCGELYDIVCHEATEVRRKIGELTDAQLARLEETCQEEIDWTEEQAGFWRALLDQLYNRYPQYVEKYYQNKEFKN